MRHSTTALVVSVKSVQVLVDYCRYSGMLAKLIFITRLYTKEILMHFHQSPQTFFPKPFNATHYLLLLENGQLSICWNQNHGETVGTLLLVYVIEYECTICGDGTLKPIPRVITFAAWCQRAPETRE